MAKEVKTSYQKKHEAFLELNELYQLELTKHKELKSKVLEWYAHTKDDRFREFIGIKLVTNGIIE